MLGKARGNGMRARLTLGHPEERHRNADTRHRLGIPHPIPPGFA
jgi:hypothetical protein